MPEGFNYLCTCCVSYIIGVLLAALGVPPLIFFLLVIAITVIGIYNIYSVRS